MQSIKDRLDVVQNRLKSLTTMVNKLREDYQILKTENNRLATTLKEKDEKLRQLENRVNSVNENLKKEDRKVIKAEIDGYVEQIDHCIAIIKAM